MKNMLIIQSWIDGQSGLISIQYKIWLNSSIKEAQKKNVILELVKDHLIHIIL